MALRGCRHGLSNAVQFRDVLPRSSSLGLLGCCGSDLRWAPTESGTDRASDWDMNDTCPTRVCSRFSSIVHEYSSKEATYRLRKSCCPYRGCLCPQAVKRQAFTFPTCVRSSVHRTPDFNLSRTLCLSARYAGPSSGVLGL
jgi:hypothetical protein